MKKLAATLFVILSFLLVPSFIFGASENEEEDLFPKMRVNDQRFYPQRQKPFSQPIFEDAEKIPSEGFPFVSEKKANEMQKRIKELETAIRKQVKNDLINKAQKRKFLGRTEQKTEGRYIEREKEPTLVTGIDEKAISKMLGEATPHEPEFFGRAFFQEGEDIAGTLNFPIPADYILGPGDSLKVIVWSDLGDETVNDATVNPEGQIYIPLLGMIGVQGLTFKQFEESILAGLSGKFKHFKGQVMINKIRSIPIFVTGEVERPGAQIVSALSTAFHALYRARGPSSRGSMRRIQINRKNSSIAVIDLYKYFTRGDKSQDVFLEAGDTIFVPTVGPRVKIIGEVIRPAVYEILDEKNL
ncbi:polysaccharide export protein, partial [bacterium]|nr:polysaccharide export protein [bacterium]